MMWNKFYSNVNCTEVPQKNFKLTCIHLGSRYLCIIYCFSAFTELWENSRVHYKEETTIWTVSQGTANLRTRRRDSALPSDIWGGKIWNSTGKNLRNWVSPSLLLFRVSSIIINTKYLGQGRIYLCWTEAIAGGPATVGGGGQTPN